MGGGRSVGEIVQRQPEKLKEEAIAGEQLIEIIRGILEGASRRKAQWRGPDAQEAVAARDGRRAHFPKSFGTCGAGKGVGSPWVGEWADFERSWETRERESG